MKCPSFFIVGAPKCGTTALYQYLRSHPNVFMSERKEPGVFLDDFPDEPFVRPMEEYLKLFRGAGRHHLAVGEATSWYLYSKVAIRLIREFNEEAKIIAMLRNPVDLVYSLYWQLRYNLDEDQEDFAGAWRLQLERKKGLHVPATCKESGFLQYAEVGKLGAQVERLLNVFQAKQVKLILFDDFIANTRAVYEEVLSFLGLCPDGRTSFARVNPSKDRRSFRLARFVRTSHPSVRRLVVILKRILGDAMMAELNMKRAVRRPLSPEFRRELVEEFKEDVEKLSRILRRDLSHWSQ